MEKNIILAGVGGQGILSIAYVIDNAALEAGFHFKQAEVHGMAQRGGAVQSNLRYADHEIHSDLIPAGRVDMVLSVEPLEVLRYWHTLAPDGWVVTSVNPYVNIPDYPEEGELMARLATYERILLVDAARIARAAGNLRAQNMVMVGVASSLLDFQPTALASWVERLFAGKGDAVVAVNRTAFDFGRRTGQLILALRDAGVGSLEALALTRIIAPDTIDPALATEWAARLRADSGLLERLGAEAGAVPCDAVRSLS